MQAAKGDQLQPGPEIDIYQQKMVQVQDNEDENLKSEDNQLQNSFQLIQDERIVNEGYDEDSKKNDEKLQFVSSVQYQEEKQIQIEVNSSEMTLNNQNANFQMANNSDLQ